MLKKIIVLVLLMFFNVCYAAQIPASQQAQYKAEIEKYAASRLPEIKRETDKEFRQAQFMHNLYLIYKHSIDISKYSDKLYDHINNINTLELYFYLDIVDITEKYVKIKQNMPATDSTGDLYAFVLPYLQQGKVNMNNIDEVFFYTGEKTDKIYKYIEEL